MQGFARPRLILCLAALSAASLAVSCSSSESGTLQLVTGQETDTFTQAPVPVSLEVDSIDSSGTATQLATASLPTSQIDLGSFDPTAAGIVQVTAFDPLHPRILAGQSVVVLFGDIAGIALPVFIQRVGEFARLPEPPSDSRPSPVVGVISGRYVVVTGGSDPTLATTTTIYDLANMTPISPSVTLPATPTSMAFDTNSSGDSIGWLINGAGVSQYDFSNGSSASVILPTGPSYLDVAGGATVSAPDGSQYIVGATRTTGAPTSAVLALDSSGNPSWLTLSEPRLGAAAAWVPSVGLVVIGGNGMATGVDAHGVEVITVATASTGAALDYPPDPSMGSGAAALGGSQVLVGGGTLPNGSSAGVRVIDLSCIAQCAPTAWPSLDIPIGSAQAFAIDATSAVVVGSELPAGAAPGLTHVYKVTSAVATEVPTKVPHHFAAAVASPIGVVGSVLLLGGAPAIESLGW
jgi:hypothetical protein